MNEYAFPRPRSINPRDGQTEDAGSGGMTLRDYFAAKALPAVVNRFGDSSTATSATFASIAYEYADAMIKARDA